MATTDYLITCRKCGKHGRLSEFKDSCDNEGCKITMAKRKKNQKPQAILLGETVNHHPRCCCDRCLEQGTAQMGAALLRAQGQQQQVKKKYVIEATPSILSSYDDSEPLSYVECPEAIYIQIYPHGKKRK